MEFESFPKPQENKREGKPKTDIEITPGTPPQSIDQLFEEAKTEDQIRDAVVGEACEGSLIYSENPPERREFINEAVQTFLSEEFSSRGIDKIQDPKAKEKAMGEMAVDLMKGLEGGVDHGKTNLKNRDQQLGRFLKNLIGNYGTPDGTLLFAESAAGAKPTERNEWPSPEDEEKVHSLLQKHLKTLNLIQSYRLTLKDYPNSILGNMGRTEFQKDWEKFETKLEKYGFKTSKEGLILPKEADPNLAKEMNSLFEGKKKQAEALDLKLKQEEKEGLQKEIPQLEHNLKELEASLARIEKAERISKKMKDQYHTENTVDQEIKHTDYEIERAKRELGGLEGRLPFLGALDFMDKRKIKKQIEAMRPEISSLEKRKTQLQTDGDSWKEANSILNKESSFNVKDEKSKIEGRLAELQKRLEQLK